MSQKLVNLNADLSKLRDEGYEMDVKNGYLLISNIPYVNSNKEVAFGTLISVLDISGSKVLKPLTHVALFVGDFPCNKDGTPIEGIRHCDYSQILFDSVKPNYSFSNKPAAGYSDYYEKMTRYIEIISAPARSLCPEVTPKTFKRLETAEEDSVFNYYDTNSSRSKINAISDKLKNHKIAIIGLGGTGSYVLDLVAKAPVSEIHLYDGDMFAQHNAFRAPGAPTIEQLEATYPKVEYFTDIYSKMHRGICPHAAFITDKNKNELLKLDFVFVCVDSGKAKRLILPLLISNGIPFVDVGMGVYERCGGLVASIRTTSFVSNKSDFIGNVISYEDAEEDEYTTNIQIADLNMLNASFAVIKWKKLLGVYIDTVKEYNNVYSSDWNQLINQCDETNS